MPKELIVKRVCPATGKTATESVPVVRVKDSTDLEGLPAQGWMEIQINVRVPSEAPNFNFEVMAGLPQGMREEIMTGLGPMIESIKETASGRPDYVQTYRLAAMHPDMTRKLFEFLKESGIDMPDFIEPIDNTDLFGGRNEN